MFAALDWPTWVDQELALTTLRILAILAIGLPLAKGLAGLVSRGASRRLSAQSAMVARTTRPC